MVMGGNTDFGQKRENWTSTVCGVDGKESPAGDTVPRPVGHTLLRAVLCGSWAGRRRGVRSAKFRADGFKVFETSESNASNGALPLSGGCTASVLRGEVTVECSSTQIPFFHLKCI